jgi:hypothetical protein
MPSHRLQQLAARIEHEDAMAARVRDDKLVRGRIRGLRGFDGRVFFWESVR